MAVEATQEEKVEKETALAAESEGVADLMRKVYVARRDSRGGSRRGAKGTPRVTKRPGQPGHARARGQAFARALRR